MIGALDRDKQIELAGRMIGLVAKAANDASLSDRTWVLLTDAPPGGWGPWGHANTTEVLVDTARAAMAKLRC